MLSHGVIASGGISAVALGAWVGAFAAVIAAVSLLTTLRNQAKRQDQDEYNRGFRDGKQSMMPELWAYRARYGQIGVRIPETFDDRSHGEDDNKS
jgi:hypothetical protein